MTKKWHISRRRMLKGTGACIALPFLEAMTPPGIKMVPTRSAPIRSTFFYMPNGVHPLHWNPSKTVSYTHLHSYLLISLFYRLRIWF